MRYILLMGLIASTTSACASNRAEDQPGSRISDTTMAPTDMANPSDTLPMIRDSVADSTP